MAYNDMPDIGTLGGTMQDQYGDSSAVSGGRLSDYQSYANEDVNTNPWGYDFSSAGYSDPGTYSLGNFFGYDQSTGLPTNSGPNAGNVGAFSFNDLENSKFGKIAMGIFGMTPIGKATNTVRGIYNAVSSGKPEQALFGLAGQFGGIPGAIANSAYQGSKGNFGPAGSVVGGLAGGPVGSMIGREVGGAMSTGRPQAAPVGAPQSGFDLGGIVQGLGQLYAASRADDGLSSAAGSNALVSQQMQNLAGMYGPNSPYAQQLRQTLERKDAAAGRRSQYGPREVQLQAALADKQAGVGESMARMANTQQSNAIALNNQRNQIRGQQLALLSNLGRQSGLFDMFKGAMTPKFIPEVSYDDSTWMGTE